MRDFNYFSNTEIIFGKGAESSVGRLCRKYGGSKIFIVYGTGSVERSGLLDTVIMSIEESGLKAKAVGGVVPNPLLSHGEYLIGEAIEFGADLILGIGGGSAIDTAKLVAHGVANPTENVWDYWSGKLPAKSIPIGCVPTLPATGTESSNSSVITNDKVEPKLKRGLNTDLNRPAFAVMNPCLCMSLPKYQIGAGVTDIFMHNAERFFTSVQGNHLSDELAIGVFRNIIRYGRIVINNVDYEAMSEVMWTGTIAHNNITGLGSMGNTKREGDWSCHQLGHSLSAIYNATHGATLSGMFYSWANYVMDADYSRFAFFGRRVFDIDENDDRVCAKLSVDMVIEFFKSLSMPVSITELLGKRPSREEIETLALHCSYNKSRTIGTFKVLDFQDILKIYQEAV